MSSADRVRVVRVTAIDDDVALLEMRLELADEVVDGPAGLDEEDYPARFLELGAKLLDGVGADDIGAWAQSACQVQGRAI